MYCVGLSMRNQFMEKNGHSLYNLTRLHVDFRNERVTINFLLLTDHSCISCFYLSYKVTTYIVARQLCMISLNYILR